MVVKGHGISTFRTCTLRLNTLRPRQNGRRFADDTLKRIFLNENVRIWIKISLKFVPKGPINNNPALVQIMAWRRSGDKPLSEPMLVGSLTHICVTRPQWVNLLVYTYIWPIISEIRYMVSWWKSERSSFKDRVIQNHTERKYWDEYKEVPRNTNLNTALQWPR